MAKAVETAAERGKYSKDVYKIIALQAVYYMFFVHFIYSLGMKKNLEGNDIICVKLK